MSTSSIENSSLNLNQKNEFGSVELTNFSDQKGLTTTQGLQLQHKLFNASISLYGGHVLSWQPIEQQPVFWMSKDTLYGNGKGIRGGVPVCFPWFGGFETDLFQHNKLVDFTNVDNALLANHGFARASLWQVESIEITEELIKVILILQGVNSTPAWNIAYELKQELTFGESFSQTLHIENKSAQNIEYTGALHSYFSVSDPKNTQVYELSDVPYFDKLTNEQNKVTPLLNCAGPIDRVYQSNSVMNIVDNEWQRIIEVSSSNCHQWVLWNPGKEIANNMDDIHQGGENEYVCLEAANTSPINIPAKSTTSFAQNINIKAIL